MTYKGLSTSTASTDKGLFWKAELKLTLVQDKKNNNSIYHIAHLHTITVRTATETVFAL